MTPWIPKAPRTRRLGLTLALLIALMVASFFPGPHHTWAGTRLLFWAVLVGGVLVVFESHRLLAFALAFAVLAFATSVVSLVISGQTLDALSMVIGAGLLLLTAGAMVATLVSARRIDRDSLLGGICGYLMLAVAFALLHTATEELWPGSYLIHGAPLAEPPGELRRMATLAFAQYFSVVTLTTVGFGDIVAVHPAGRLLTAAEALIGQLYLATLIGGVVGALGRPGEARSAEPVRDDQATRVET
jgi:voltage-gated potassium channel Kch